MLLFTVYSLEDNLGKLRFMIQLSISIIFAVLSGSTASYLIFYECRINKPAQFLLPPIVYFIVQMIMQELTFPYILCNILILVVLVLGIFLIEKLVISYISAKSHISHAVSVTAVNEMYEKKLNHELVMKNYLTEKNARLEERESISRNIHNSVGHSITAAIMTLDAADMLFETAPVKAREKMNAANERIRKSLNSIRHAVRVLDSESEFISMVDFIGELTAVIDSFVMDTAIQIRIDFSDSVHEQLIPHEHTEFLTGAVQELLTNGVRHGKANMFTVGLKTDSRHIKLIVLDNGRSDFSPQNAQKKIRNGFGLKKLISYAEKCGGSAIFENENGFQSAITLPLYKEGEYGSSARTFG